MGFLGSNRGLTPNLDRMASQATVFSRAYAQVPLTTPSHAAILTGTYPQFNHVNYLGDPLGKSLPFLPEIFRKNGYKTAAFVGALVLDPAKLAPGFDRGFDVYDAGFHRRRAGEDNYHSLERRGDEVLNRALAWLHKHPSGPFFLWIHLYDPHDPYTPPEPYQTRYHEEPYDGEIAYTDSVVGKLLSELHTRNLFDGSLIAVVADHGEAFGEHGEKHSRHLSLRRDNPRSAAVQASSPTQGTQGRRAGRIGRRRTIDTPGCETNDSCFNARPGLSSPTANKAELPDQLPVTISQHAVYSESGYGHLSFGWSVLSPGVPEIICT